MAEVRTGTGTGWLPPAAPSTDAERPETDDHDSLDTATRAVRCVTPLVRPPSRPAGVRAEHDDLPPTEDAARPVRPRPKQTRREVSTRTVGADRVFLGLTRTSALVVLAVIIAVGVFLAIQATPALRSAKFSFLTTQAWEPDVHHFGIAGIMVGTLLIAVEAVIISLPVALGLALFITEVAPARIRRTLVSLVDLMAAVPSVVYGLWALEFLEGRTVGLARWISTWFGWIPIFKVTGGSPSNPVQSGTLYSASTFIVGIAVSLMVIPILCSVMRESFSQAPLGEREGAYALGATRWGMIRSVVLPFGRGGIVGGTMLGLGRALGETIVVLLIISPGLRHQPAHPAGGRQLRLRPHRHPGQRVVGLRDIGPHGRRSLPLRCDHGGQLRRLDGRLAVALGRRE